jgi:hypothetical protein
MTATAKLIKIKIIPAAAPLDSNPNSNACLYIYNDVVVLENRGPPPVIISCMSKRFTDHIVIRIRLIIINGFNNGSVI